MEPNPPQRPNVRLETQENENDERAVLGSVYGSRETSGSSSNFIKKSKDLDEVGAAVPLESIRPLSRANSPTDMEQKSNASPSSLGRRGDPRMHRAMAARLANPNMTLLDALLEGGFEFPDLHTPGKSDRTIYDTDNVLLCQRKNQLSRRLRLAKRQQLTKAATASLIGGQGFPGLGLPDPFPNQLLSGIDSFSAQQNLKQSLEEVSGGIFPLASHPQDLISQLLSPPRTPQMKRRRLELHDEEQALVTRLVRQRSSTSSILDLLYFNQLKASTNEVARTQDANAFMAAIQQQQNNHASIFDSGNMANAGMDQTVWARRAMAAPPTRPVNSIAPDFRSQNLVQLSRQIMNRQQQVSSPFIPCLGSVEYPTSPCPPSLLSDITSPHFLAKNAPEETLEQSRRLGISPSDDKLLHSCIHNVELSGQQQKLQHGENQSKLSLLAGTASPSQFSIASVANLKSSLFPFHR